MSSQNQLKEKKHCTACCCSIVCYDSCTGSSLQYHFIVLIKIALLYVLLTAQGLLRQLHSVFSSGVSGRLYEEKLRVLHFVACAWRNCLAPDQDFTLLYK
jgi:hypothetical protein